MGQMMLTQKRGICCSRFIGTVKNMRIFRAHAWLKEDANGGMRRVVVERNTEDGRQVGWGSEWQGCRGNHRNRMVIWEGDIALNQETSMTGVGTISKEKMWQFLNYQMLKSNLKDVPSLHYSLRHFLFCIMNSFVCITGVGTISILVRYVSYFEFLFLFDTISFFHVHWSDIDWNLKLCLEFPFIIGMGA